VRKFDHPKTETVYEWEQYNGEGPPKKLREVIAWLGEILDSIPAEYRDAATIEFDSRTSYDQSLATIEVAYERPPTPAEVDARRAHSEEVVRQDLERARMRVKEQERQLADLQKSTSE
jgi:hypothetical protein